MSVQRVENTHTKHTCCKAKPILSQWAGFLYAHRGKARKYLTRKIPRRVLRLLSVISSFLVQHRLHTHTTLHSKHTHYITHAHTDTTTQRQTHSHYITHARIHIIHSAPPPHTHTVGTHTHTHTHTNSWHTHIYTYMHRQAWLHTCVHSIFYPPDKTRFEKATFWSLIYKVVVLYSLAKILG